MKVGSMFSGVGGLDLAVHALFPDAQPAWFFEWEDAPSAVLAEHWPDVPNHRDAFLPPSDLEPVDVLVAGYPCQPFSTSGKQQGHDDDRNGWPAVLNALRLLRPRYLLAENVASHLRLGFDRVLADLAREGFDVEWTVLRASDVGAPHHRSRLFFVASDSRRSGGHEALELNGHSTSGSYGPGVPDQRDRGPVRARPEWGEYADAIARWERVIGPAPHPVDERLFLAPEFCEWLMGWEQGWTAAAGSRAKRLKACGNGVVPRQAFAAYSHLLSNLPQGAAA